MDKNYLIAEEIVFNAKPDAVPFNYRTSYKIGQLCLILSICCGRKGCSYFKLHMIAMSLCTKQEMLSLKNFTDNVFNSYTLVRFDPAVNRAVKYAIADGVMLQQVNGLFKLTTKGKSFADAIKKESDLMVSEKYFLNDLSNKLTEDKIKNLMSIWRYSDAPNK